jgi:RNA polymerase sigma-70 factor (ECF subfamily)
VNLPDAQDTATPSARHRWFVEEVFPHGAQLKAYLRGRFPDTSDAEDIVQESFLRIWKSHTLQPTRHTKTFLFEIASRLAIDLLRHNRRSPILALPDLAGSDVIDQDADVVEQTCTREEIALLARALEALPSRCRTIMYLRQIEGMPQREIAAKLGLSELTVQTQVVLGLRKLRLYFRRHGLREEQR